jgi:hypothetical protein
MCECNYELGLPFRFRVVRAVTDTVLHKSEISSTDDPIFILLLYSIKMESQLIIDVSIGSRGRGSRRLCGIARSAPIAARNTRSRNSRAQRTYSVEHRRMVPQVRYIYSAQRLGAVKRSQCRTHLQFYCSSVPEYDVSTTKQDTHSRTTRSARPRSRCRQTASVAPPDGAAAHHGTYDRDTVTWDTGSHEAAQAGGPLRRGLQRGGGCGGRHR